MKTQKEKFLRNEFLTMSIIGALGRSNTYSDSASPEDKNRFRIALRDKLDIISRRYESAVTEDEHLSRIKELSDNLTSQFSDCLRNAQFRIGIAQKALNLYLKYLWCVDLIETPPHCPFDSIVIDHLPECRDLNWTSIDSIADYERLVLAARKVADNSSLTEWEFGTWLDGVKLERKSKKVAKSETKESCSAVASKSILLTFTDGGKILITGTVVSQGKYADGKDICELYIHKKGSDALPHEHGQPKPIPLTIGQSIYEADVRETGAGAVWISSVLYENTPKREEARLVDVLKKIGLKKGDKIKIIPNDDGTFSLERLNDD
jgi:hypothetical protein